MLNQWISGLVAGACSTSVCHPFDLIKAQLQIDTCSNGHFVNEGAKIRSAISSLVASESKSPRWRNLYRGFRANLVANTITWASYFAIYTRTKEAAGNFLLFVTGDRLNGGGIFVAATSAGFLTCLISNPLWSVKTRVFLQPEKFSDGFVRPHLQVVKTEGPRALYRGLLPGILATSHGGLQFVAYELLKNAFPLSTSDGGISIWKPIFFSAISKVFASVATYPTQVLRTRLQLSGALSFTEAVKSLLRKEGVYGLFKGIIPNTLKLLPSTCITFTVYEVLNHAFA